MAMPAIRAAVAPVTMPTIAIAIAAAKERRAAVIAPVYAATPRGRMAIRAAISKGFRRGGGRRRGNRRHGPDSEQSKQHLAHFNLLLLVDEEENAPVFLNVI
jgi:hypothetical protein